MQVSPVGPTVPATIAGHAGLLLLPHLLRLTSLSPKTQALREQHQAEREEDDRRQRDASAEANQTAAAAAADARPTFAEVTAEAERKMAPGSRAAQRQIANEEQQKTTLQRDKFQRTLADAAARENATAGRASAPSAVQGGAEGEPHGPAAPQSTAAAKGAPAGTAQPNQSGGSVAVVPADRAGLAPSQTNGVATGVPQLPAGAASAAASANSNAVKAVGALPPSQATTAPPAGDALTPSAPGNSAAGASKAAQPAPATQNVTATVNAPGIQANAARPAMANSGPEAASRQTGKNDANFERILRVLRAQISQKRSQTTLQLDPPELGTIRLHLGLRDDTLTLRVEPQTQVAYRLLYEHLDSLRDGLHASGVHLEHVEIRPPAAQAAPQAFDLPPHSGGGGTGGGAGAETDHPQHSGTDSPAAGPSQNAALDENSEPSAEPRVNIWA